MLAVTLAVMKPSLSETVKLLHSVPLFRTLSDQDLGRIVDSPQNGVVEFPSGATVMEEGELGDCMYIVLKGTVDVRIRAVDGREITIATLKEGDFFGEQALLPGATGRRNASVRVLKTAHLFRIGKQDVLLGVNAPTDDGLPSIEDPELVTEEQRVRMLLRGVRLFRSLSRADFDRISNWAEVVDIPPGDIVLREGGRGDYMYVVLEGTVEVFVVDDNGKIVVLAELPRGHYFGEQALIPSGPGVRNANVRAKFAVRLIKVARDFFQLVLNRDHKLTLALKVIGDAQRKKIQDVRHPENDW